MIRIITRSNWTVLLSVTVAMFVSLAVPCSPISAASGNVLFHLDGASNRYTDLTGPKTLGGTPAYSNQGKAFGARMAIVSPAKDSSLGAFPYGAYGIDGTDANNDGDYTDSGDVDPAKLLDQMKADGVYNVALSSSLGSVGPAKITYVLDAARARNMKLIVRSIAYVGSGNYSLDLTVMERNLLKFKGVFSDRPELESVIFAWYSYDEPQIKFKGDGPKALSEMRKAYSLYKKHFPDKPVLTVFNQNQSIPDGSDADTVGEGMLGESQNPYDTGVANIVGLNVYTAVPVYGYHAIKNVYTHARKVVDRETPGARIWAVAQAHAVLSNGTNTPEPHQLYRQVNDWFRAGPDTGLRNVDGWLWYSWHFAPGATNAPGDLEDNRANRDMAKLIGQRIHAGTLVTHKLPYRSELYLSSTPSSTIRFPRLGHLNLSSGTITFAFTHAWAGNDGLRHVLLDTGAGSTTNRLLIEKTAGNVLRLVIRDSSGGERWVGVPVSSNNMPGSTASSGYSEIAVTWSNGVLALYLDGYQGGARGGAGTGKLSSAGSNVFLGTDLTGRSGANGTFSYLTIRSAAGTSSEVASWGKYSYLAAAPGAPGLSSPLAGASTTDRTPTLKWSNNSSAVKYKVQLSKSSTFGTLVRDITVTGPNYTAPQLSAGTYYWRVRAYDNYGVGRWSVTRSFKVQ